MVCNFLLWSLKGPASGFGVLCALLLLSLFDELISENFVLSIVDRKKTRFPIMVIEMWVWNE